MKKAVSVFLTLCLLCGMSTLSYAEESMFAGGSGTEEDPYQIATLNRCCPSRKASTTAPQKAGPASISC